MGARCSCDIMDVVRHDFDEHSDYEPERKARPKALRSHSRSYTTTHTDGESTASEFESETESSQIDTDHSSETHSNQQRKQTAKSTAGAVYVSHENNNRVITFLSDYECIDLDQMTRSALSDTPCTALSRSGSSSSSAITPVPVASPIEVMRAAIKTQQQMRSEMIQKRETLRRRSLPEAKIHASITSTLAPARTTKSSLNRSTSPKSAPVQHGRQLTIEDLYDLNESDGLAPYQLFQEISAHLEEEKDAVLDEKRQSKVQDDMHDASLPETDLLNSSSIEEELAKIPSISSRNENLAELAMAAEASRTSSDSEYEYGADDDSDDDRHKPGKVNRRSRAKRSTVRKPKRGRRSMSRSKSHGTNLHGLLSDDENEDEFDEFKQMHVSPRTIAPLSINTADASTTKQVPILPPQQSPTPIARQSITTSDMVDKHDLSQMLVSDYEEEDDSLLPLINVERTNSFDVDMKKHMMEFAQIEFSKQVAQRLNALRLKESTPSNGSDIKLSPRTPTSPSLAQYTNSNEDENEPVLSPASYSQSNSQSVSVLSVSQSTKNAAKQVTW